MFRVKYRLFSIAFLQLLRHYIFLSIDRMFFMLYCKGFGNTLLELYRSNRLA